MDSKDGLPLIRESGLVLIMNTPKGRGVFASKDISAGSILEVSPVLVLDRYENDAYIRKTELYHYTYNWPSHAPDHKVGSSDREGSLIKTQAIILGLGSLFNHSNLHQNVGWTRDIENRLITYTALREIRRGEELCISYGDRLTFVDADASTLHNKKEEEEDTFASIEIT